MRDDLPRWLLILCTSCAVFIFFCAFYAYGPDWVTGVDEVGDIISDFIPFAMFGSLSCLGVWQINQSYKEEKKKKKIIFLWLCSLSLFVIYFIFQEYKTIKSYDFHPLYKQKKTCAKYQGDWNEDGNTCANMKFF